jgi:DNA-directed RNA polymerase specialized sigma24 family protein
VPWRSAGCGMSKRTPRKTYPFPAVTVDIKTLFALRTWLSMVLMRLGVQAQDVDDVVFDVMTSAHMTAAVGRYRPSPALPANDCLKSWLYGFCWRRAIRYHGVAWRRMEIPYADVRVMVADEGVDAHARLDARAALRVLATLSPEQREILIAVADGATLTAYRRRKRWGLPTMHRRLQRARRAYIQALRRRLW